MPVRSGKREPELSTLQVDETCRANEKGSSVGVNANVAFRTLFSSLGPYCAKMVSTIGTNVCEVRSRRGIWLNLGLFQLVFFLADKRFFWRFACIKPNSDSRGLLVMGQDLKAA